MNLAFSGCGFLGIYQVGVASCFKEHAHNLATGKISGTSAGALVACCFVCDVCLGQCTSWVLELAAKARAGVLGPLNPNFRIVHLLRKGLSDFLPDNCHELCSGRLFVSLTRVSDRKNVIVSQYDSKQDVLQALLCSTFVPFYSGLVPPTYKGVRYVDGGLTDNLPVLDEDTVTVSPFAGETDICPTDDSQNFAHITLANSSFQFTGNNAYRLSRALFPPHPEILAQMCKQGFDDALRYLQQNNLISCMRHLSIKSTLTPVYCDEDGNSDDEVDNTLVIVENLPPSVVAALQAAVESVNYGRLAKLYKNPAFQVLSVVMTPWLLPLDIFYNFFVRFLQWIPYIPEDARNITNEMVELVKHLLSRIEKHRHKYSTRFTCQVAITEVNYKPQRRSTYADITSEYYNEPVIRNLNIGFAVDFEAGLYANDVPSTSETLKQLEARLENMDIDSLEIETHGQGQDIHLHAEGRNIGADSLIPCDEIIDTFEQCISTTNRRDSVLSFYYNETEASESGRPTAARRRSSVSVTELFTLKHNEITLPRVSAVDEMSEYGSDTVTEGSEAVTSRASLTEDTDTVDLSWDEDVREVVDPESRDASFHDQDSGCGLNYSQNWHVRSRNFTGSMNHDVFPRSTAATGTNPACVDADISTAELSFDMFETINGESSPISTPSEVESFTNIDDQTDSTDSMMEEYFYDFRLYSGGEMNGTFEPLASYRDVLDTDSLGDSCILISESNSALSLPALEADVCLYASKFQPIAPLVVLDDSLNDLSPGNGKGFNDDMHALDVSSDVTSLTSSVNSQLQTEIGTEVNSSPPPALFNISPLTVKDGDAATPDRQKLDTVDYELVSPNYLSTLASGQVSLVDISRLKTLTNSTEFFDQSVVDENLAQCSSKNSCESDSI